MAEIWDVKPLITVADRQHVEEAGQASGCNISCNNEATISCPPE